MNAGFWQMLIYLDSMILIYAFDSTDDFHSRATTRLDALNAARDTVVVSDLTRMECRMLPLRINDTVRLARLNAFFKLSDVIVTSMTAAIFDRAAEIRAKYNFTALDSLHLAAAIDSGGELFITNDKRLTKFQEAEVAIELLP